MRVVIVDDEPPGRARMKTVLATEPDVEIVAECVDGGEAIHAIQTLGPDLVVMDIQMPELNGFDVIDAIGEDAMPFVIFVTAYDAFAIAAFDANAVDYVVKPYGDERLKRAIARVRNRLATQSPPRLTPDLVRAQKDYKYRLVVSSGPRFEVVRSRDVDWFEAADNYVVLHTGKETRAIRSTISDLEKRLDPGDFMRIHRSTIVNTGRIRKIEPHNTTDFMIHLNDDTQLPSSRAYRESIRRFIQSLLK
jgi:two-component system, LytTR family, response regulator